MRWCGDRPCAARLSVPSLATLRHHHARAQNLACGVLEGTPAAEADEPIEPIDTAGLVSKLADATTDEPASIDQLQMPARQTPAVAKAAQAGQQGQSAALGSARARLLRLRVTRLAAPGDPRPLGERRGHWAPCHCRRCSSQPPPKPPIPPPFDHPGWACLSERDHERGRAAARCADAGDGCARRGAGWRARGRLCCSAKDAQAAAKLILQCGVCFFRKFRVLTKPFDGYHPRVRRRSVPRQALGDVRPDAGARGRAERRAQDARGSECRAAPGGPGEVATAREERGLLQARDRSIDR